MSWSSVQLPSFGVRGGDLEAAGIGHAGRAGGAEYGDVVVLVADLRDDPVEEGFGAVGGVGAVVERRVASHVGGGGVDEHVKSAQPGEQVRGTARAVDRGNLRALGAVSTAVLLLPRFRLIDRYGGESKVIDHGHVSHCAAGTSAGRCSARLRVAGGPVSGDSNAVPAGAGAPESTFDVWNEVVQALGVCAAAEA